LQVDIGGQLLSSIWSADMKNIKLTIEYEGTNYAGWQRQKNAVTVQQKLEEAAQKLTGEEIEIIGSSRTDAGVHARGFAANFFTSSTIPPSSFREALNSKLPEDIVILQAEQVSDDFHARYSCTGKQYSYTILNRVQPSALERNFVYHYKRQLDLDAMKIACKFYIGEHDFYAFRSTGSSVKTSVRNINRAWIEKNGDKLKFYVEADGFLYNMVRIMAGTLIDVGIGKVFPQDIAEIIKSKDRNRAGNTAPASGLCLEAVFYN
jgi:tRNA pseudouridine38-40 synthase